MKGNAARWIGLAIGIAFSAAGLWWALKDVKFAELQQELLAANPWWLLLALVLMLAGLVCRSLRWRILMQPLASVSVLDVNAFSMIGQVANALLPAKLGEVARTSLVARKYHVDFAAVLSTVAADRLLDMAALVLLALALPLYFPLTPDLAQAMVALTATAVIGVGVLVAILRAADGPERFGRWLTGFMPRFLHGLIAFGVSFLLSFRKGLTYLNDPRRLALGVLYTLAAWLLIVLYAMCTLMATGLFDQVPPGAGLVITVTTNLGSSVPSTPGYIGVYHSAAKLGMDLMHANIDDTRIATFAVILHALWYLPAIAFGLIALAYAGVSLSDVQKMGADSGH